MGTDRARSSSDDPSYVFQQAIDRAREWLAYLHALEADLPEYALSVSPHLQAFLAELLELRARRARRGWSTAAIDEESFEELCTIAAGPLPDTSVVDDLLYAEMSAYATTVVQLLVSNRGRPFRAAVPPETRGPDTPDPRVLLVFLPDTAGPPGQGVDFNGDGDVDHDVFYVDRALLAVPRDERPAGERGRGGLGAAGPTDGAPLDFGRLAAVIFVLYDAVATAFVDGAAVWVPRPVTRASLAGATLGLIPPAVVLRAAAGAGAPAAGARGGHPRRSRDCIGSPAAPTGRSAPRCSGGARRGRMERRPDRLVSLVGRR